MEPPHGRRASTLPFGRLAEEREPVANEHEPAESARQAQELERNEDRRRKAVLFVIGLFCAVIPFYS